MAVKKWIFDLNILQKSRIPRMELVQGDTDANVFQIHLKTLERYTEVPLDLTDSYVTVTVKKADDTIVVGEAQIIDSTNGIIEYTCRGNELSYPGLVIATIEVYDTTHIKRFTTTQFKFYVVEQLDDGSGIPSTTEYTVLTDLIAQTQSVVTNENERIENENTRIANENIRQENESIRQNNEQARVTAENNRVNAESIREANENERINNENIRQANEETRNTAEANRKQDENLRQMAEQERINAENARVAAENARNEAELARKNAENIRQSNESARISEENTRILQENARVQVENERSANENIREANEAVRQNNESVRITAEGNRVQAEAIREANEAVRQNNESVRITAEGNRVQAEAIREANEAERISNENTRIANENTRQSNEAIRQNNESIRQSNEATRINNENIRQQQEQARQASMADIENRWNTLTTAQQQDAEVINARTSTVKNKTFPALTNRIEELEQDTITPVYNETITIDGGIGSIPSNAAEGQVSVTIGGQTWTNLIDGAEVAPDDSRTFDSIDGHIYFDLYNGVIIAGDGTEKTVINAGDESANMAVFDLTQIYGQGNEPTAEQAQARLYYINGTKSTLSAGRIKIVGKNLFHPKHALKNRQYSIREYLGVQCLSWIASSNMQYGLFMDGMFEKGKRYMIIVDMAVASGNASLRWYYDDGTVQTTQSSQTVDSFTRIISTSAAGKNVIGIGGTWNAGQRVYVRLDTFQIQKADASQEYEPYMESNTYFVAKDPETDEILQLRSVPSGAKDEINVSEGKLIQRIGLDYSDVDNPTFTRNSVACLSDGTQVAANQPRFEDGPFAGEKAIMIEERTTNLFPADRRWAFNAEWTSATLNGTYTVSIHGGTGKLILSGGATGEVVAGQSLTFSVSNATVTFTPVDGTPERCQLEQKGYATSFVDGTRAGEILLIQNNGVLNPQEGTIECWAWFPTFQQLHMYLLLRTTPSVNGKYLYFGLGNSSLQLRFWDTQGTSQHLFGRAGSVYSNNWHYYVIKWGSFGTKVIVDDYTEINTTLQIHPDALSTQYIRLGSYDSVYSYMNGFIADLRISSIARTDEEILATYRSGQPLSVDAYTTYKLNFDGDLTAQRAKPLIYQLAEPVITQYQPQSLIGYPNGTVYWEPVVKDIAIYNNGIAIVNPNIPIKAIQAVYKIDGQSKIEIPLANVTVAGDKLSFAITGAQNGEAYEYIYEYDTSLTTIPTIEATVNMNLKAVVNSTSKAVDSLNKYTLDLNAFTVAMLLNHEMRLTLLEVQ